MAIVILFGGGDAGGLVIDATGVHPIPPFDPGLRNQLQAVAKLTAAAAGGSANPQRDRLIRLVSELAADVVGQVEREVGEIDANSGLIYTDDSGGFVCGSTGRPPVPLPWPPANLPTVERLTRLGLIGSDALEVLRAAAERRADVVSLLRDPEQEGVRLGFEVSKSAAAQIRQLRLGDPSEIEDPVDREIVEFFHKAVADESLIDRWASEPLAVADELGILLSNEAARRIVTANAANTLGLDRAGEVMSPAAVAIVVVIVIVVYSRETHVPVIDRSGIEKF
jgi:hypothetical protein